VKILPSSPICSNLMKFPFLFALLCQVLSGVTGEAAQEEESES
jgi:hypothetical protein